MVAVGARSIVLAAAHADLRVHLAGASQTPRDLARSPGGQAGPAEPGRGVHHLTMTSVLAAIFSPRS